MSRLLMIYSVVYSYGGVPLLYMGDELALLNDPGWADDPAHTGDNRWLHRPPMDWPRPTGAPIRHRRGPGLRRAGRDGAGPQRAAGAAGRRRARAAGHRRPAGAGLSAEQPPRGTADGARGVRRRRGAAAACGSPARLRGRARTVLAAPGVVLGDHEVTCRPGPTPGASTTEASTGPKVPGVRVVRPAQVPGSAVEHGDVGLQLQEAAMTMLEVGAPGLPPDSARAKRATR